MFINNKPFYVGFSNNRGEPFLSFIVWASYYNFRQSISTQPSDYIPYITPLAPFSTRVASTMITFYVIFYYCSLVL